MNVTTLRRAFDQVGATRCARRWARIAPALICTSLLAAPAEAQDALKFFKNYFVTGRHFAAGVSVKGAGQNGFATKDIVIAADAAGVAGVPAGAEVLAAFLYWSTVTSSGGSGATGAAFNGYDISVIAKPLNPSGTPPCWSSGGASGSGGGSIVLKAYRADVLPFLPPGADGRRTAIGAHSVRLPDSGTGNSIPSTLGASLVLIYRDPALPLSGTVIYDGGATLNQANQALSQTLQGWYHAADAGALASLTMLVGNGQSNFTEQLTVKSAAEATLFSATNPFVGPDWDTYGAAVPLPGGASSARVELTRGSTTGSFDCLSLHAIVLTTRLEDGDGDGIPTRLESAGTSGTLSDPNGVPLPDLYAMGARPNIKDLFIEINFMRSSSGYANPLQEVPPGHSHLPSREALDMVARMFRFAPERINVHFDVGNNYQAPAPPPNCPTANAAQWTPSCAIIPAALAEGGEFIEETPCVPSATQSCLFPDYPGPLACSVLVTCEFPLYPGTVGWKSGYRFYKDEPLNYRRSKMVGGYLVDDGPDEPGCFAAESDRNPNGTPNLSTTCYRRFSRARKDLFHYALWAHAVGLPRAEVDDPSTPHIDERHTPRNMSGFGDFAGGHLMVTLGLWDNAVGTTFMQASTFAHELGHNLARRHGGDPDQPNCKPNYQSVMNYLFQVRGLTTATGMPVIGYSNQELPALDENNLNEAAGLGTMDYRTRWYAPWNDSYIDVGLATSPATRRCNGTEPTTQLMARIEGTSVTGPIDWNADGDTLDLLGQDVNFSGLNATAPFFDALAPGSNDWNRIDLRQVGSGRNVGGWSLDSGFWDAGFWDAGVADAGFWDAGFWDAGFWDAGFWDAGFWDAGFWDAGAENDDDVPRGELDLDLAEALGNAPNALTAALGNGQGKKSIVLAWQPPHVASSGVSFYEVYRVIGTTVTPQNFLSRVAIGGPIYAPTTTVTDTSVKPNETYTYFVLAQFNDGRRSGVSNYAVASLK